MARQRVLRARLWLPRSALDTRQQAGRVLCLDGSHRPLEIRPLAGLRATIVRSRRRPGRIWRSRPRFRLRRRTARHARASADLVHAFETARDGDGCGGRWRHRGAQARRCLLRAVVIMDSSARSTVRSLVASQIREVANAGIGDPDILPFWFGEPDEVTPGYIRDTAIAALAAGETFYTLNFGIPELRGALATYISRLHHPIGAGRIAVTASGMSALMLATEALVNPGHRVVCVTPLWPNLTEIPKILGADVTRVALRFDRGGWTLDLDRLLDALTPGTCAVVINSPNNPTGWTLRAGEQRTILEHCRKHGIWIIADDVYERLYYAGGEGSDAFAPSF